MRSSRSCSPTLLAQFVFAFVLVAAWAVVAPAAAAPAAPTGLTAHFTQSSSNASTPLTFVWLWTDNSSDEDGFEISYRIGTTGAFSPLVNAAANQSGAQFTTGPAFPVGTVFQFQVRAFQSAGPTYSGATNTASVTVPARTFVAPTTVAGTPQSESVIRVTWTNTSTEEDGVELWMAEQPGGTYAKLGDVLFYQAQQINVTGLVPSIGYRFKLLSYKEGTPRTTTAFSTESATLFTNAPNAPTNLAVTGVGSTTIGLSWTDNSAVESGFDILSRPVGVGSFVVRKVVSANSTSATVSNLAPGVSHEFVVRARADYGTPASISTNSNTVTQLLHDVISSPHYAQTLLGQPFTYTLTTTTGSALSSRNVTGLPAGLSYDNNTGVVSGIPTAAGVTQANMQATFADGASDTAILAIRVLNPPVVGTTIPAQNLVTGTPVSIPLGDKFTDPEASSAVRVTTTLGAMDFIFFDSQTPLTKANFLSYMASGAYTNNLFHRSVPGFVIQGGAFKATTAPNNFTAVPTSPAVTNEPGISNIRGTVAMAKLGGNPNSATNQWFVNLDNNGLNSVTHPTNNLDVQNGGFTAFARVAGNGMNVADAIAAKPTGDYNVVMDSAAQSFTEWPLNSTDALALMDNTKVVGITGVASVPVLSYTVTSNTNPGAVTASVSNGNLNLTPVDSGTASITVTATNLDGNTVSQTFQVTTISNVATLSNLVLGTGSLSPTFSSATTSYTASLPNAATTVTVTPTLTQSHATVTVNGDPVTSGTASAPIPLSVGGNTITVLVTAEDGSTTKTYTLTPARSAVGLASTLITVNEETGVANIPLVRTGGASGSVSVSVTTNNGTATAPGDFTAKTGQEVVMGDGVSTLDVPITLVTPGTDEPNEMFTVTIGNFNGGTAMSAAETATVRIVDSVDNSVPTVTMSYPTATTLNLATGAAITVTGTATDNKGVKEVLVSHAGGSFVNAALTPVGSGSPLSTTYTLDITPKTGVNTITVKSIDQRNKVSTLLTRTFTVLRPLVVNASSALGSVTTGYVGTTFREVGKSHTITATAKAPATGFAGAIFTGWTVNWAGNTPTPPSVPVTQAEGAARIGVAFSSLEKNALTFIFREGLVLTANFIANPFASMAGSYNGLIRPSATQPDRAPLGGAPGTEDGSTRSNSTEGLFKATVTNTGAFSGTLTIDGTVLNVAGSFDHNGNARFGTARALTLTVARLNKPSLIVALHLDMVTPGTGDNITGTVTATDFKKSVTTAVSTVNADKAFYGFQTLAGNGITAGSAVVTLGSTLGRFEGEVVTGTGIPANTTIQAVDSPSPNKLTLTANATATNAAASLTFTRNVPTAYLGAANANGTFTAVFPAEDVGSQTAGFTTQDYPQGDGYGTITVTKAGVVTVAGTLADNTAISMTSALSQANTFPLFAQLYTKLGFVSGFVTLDSTQTTSDMAAADLQWLRPFIGTSHYYPYGWPEVIKVDLMAAKYAAITGQSVLKAANGADIQLADEDGNAALAFSDGQLSETLNKSAYLSLADVVTRVPDNDPTFTLLITRTTGAISGMFDHTDDTKPTYQGMIYQKGPNAGGYGFFLTRQPVPIDYTGESGGVTIIGQP